MADIIPFKGVRYNPDKISDLSKVIAPPYDVISSEEQDFLYSLHPNNIIRILYGKDFPSDNEKQNKYTRAKTFLKNWMEQGILKRDKEDSIYIYLQEFKFCGQVKTRIGFIALLKLEDFYNNSSAVYPHETTLSAPKEDRLKLLTSIEANLGPIFALFGDEDNAVTSILLEWAKSPPIIDIVDYQGILNKLWRISDKKVIGQLINLMKNKNIFIADGHHRYEVALEFSRNKDVSKYGYILTYFTDIYSDGIVILPTYRLVCGVDKNTISAFLEKLKGNFKISEFNSKQSAMLFLSEAGQFEKRFVLYYDNRYKGLLLEDSKDSLDVSVLHDMILGPLERDIELSGKKISIDFTKDLDYAINVVDNGDYSFLVILNPTRVTQVRDMSFSGRRMPQKSTYFYPKVLTGLVINVF